MNENENDKHSIDLDLIRKFSREITEYGIPSVFLGGGAECLINPDIRNIIRIIRNQKRIVTDDVIITNGYGLDDDIIDLLIDLQWEKIFISLDASSPETYKRIRGFDLSFVEHRIERLLEQKHIRGSVFPLIRVSFVVMDENKHEVDSFYEKWKAKVDIIDYQQLTKYSDSISIIHNIDSTGKTCIHPFTRLMVDSFGVRFNQVQEKWNQVREKPGRL